MCLPLSLRLYSFLCFNIFLTCADFLNMISCTIYCSKYIHTKLLGTFWVLQAFSFLFGLRCCYACVLVGWASSNQAAIENRNTVRIWLANQCMVLSCIFCFFCCCCFLRVNVNLNMCKKDLLLSTGLNSLVSSAIAMQ